MFKRILKLSVCALLLITMVLGAVACNPKPSEETFKEAQKDSVGDALTQIDNISNNIAGADPNNVSRDISVKVNLSAECLAILSELADDENMSWINNLKLNISQNTKNNVQSTALTLLSGSKEIVSANSITDMGAGAIYMAIPVLASEYLKIDLDDFAQENAPYLNQMMSEMLTGTSSVLPDAETVKKLVEKYYGIFVDSFGEVEINKKSSISIGDIEEDCIEYTSVMTQNDVLNTAITILKKMKSDKDIKNIVENLATIYASDSSEDFYEQFTDAIDTAIEQIEEGKSELEKPNSKAIVWTSYTNKKAEVLATSFKINVSDDKTYTAFWGKLQKKKNIASEMWVKEGKTKLVHIEGEFVEDKDLLSGTYKIKANDTKMLTINIDEINTKQLDEGYLNGSITISPDEGLADTLENYEFGNITAASLSLKFTFEHTKESFKVKTSVLNNKSNFFSITVDSKVGEGKKISIPKDVVTDPGEWSDKFNYDNLESKLTEGGIPENIVDAVTGSMSGSSTPDDVENDYDTGYNDGYTAGWSDALYGYEYDDSSYGSNNYKKGYKDGYYEGYIEGLN